MEILVDTITVVLYEALTLVVLELSKDVLVCLVASVKLTELLIGSNDTVALELVELFTEETKVVIILVVCVEVSTLEVSKLEVSRLMEVFATALEAEAGIDVMVAGEWLDRVVCSAARLALETNTEALLEKPLLDLRSTMPVV